MAVWAVMAMDVDWFAVGDEYFMRFTARDGSEIAVSMPGSVFEAHGAKILAAIAKRQAAHCAVTAIGGGKALP